MSGPDDTREPADEAGTPAGVPTDSVPPSFGAAEPPADPQPAPPDPPAGEAEPAAPASIGLPPFGLEAPWWAAESTETAPPEDEEPVSAGVPPGTLVAGVGVPDVDSRGAVPADPIVQPPLAFGDTDPDGFPAVRPEDGQAEGAQRPTGEPPEDTTAGPTETPEPDTEPDGTTVDETTVEDAAEQRPAEDVPAASEEGSPEESSPEEEETPPEDTAPEDTARASAFERAREAEDASTASFGQILEPDAILPVGVAPPTGGPFPDGGRIEAAAVTAEQAAVITPVYHAEGGVPLDTPPPPGPPPQGAPKGGGYNKRRPLLIGGGAALILAAAVALFTVDGTGSDGDQGGAVSAVESPAAARSTPAAPPATPTPTPTGPSSSIDNERTDPVPLAFRDVFPTRTIDLGGLTYTRDRWSLNREASYAARGSMLQALERENCRKIIRATFVHRPSSLAVTSGIAVMPTKDAALRVSRAGNPATYEWFRGMDGKHTPNLDKAGGYAAVTVRGRYIAYAYVQWANGTQAQPGDPVIKQAARRFLDYDLRPIIARARR